jgi:hypothetical protein
MTIEETMFHKKVKDLGWDLGDFSLKLVHVDDLHQGIDYLDRKVYRVTRTSNGKSREYSTGHGAMFPDDFGNDVIAGEFE